MYGKPGRYSDCPETGSAWAIWSHCSVPLTMAWIDQCALRTADPGFLQEQREDRSDNNRGDIDAAGRDEDIQR
jgi:hypothetical protein